MRNRLFIIVLVLLLSVFISYGYSAQRKQTSSKKLSHNLKITVEDIQYIGDSRYKMTIGFTNLSTDTLRINLNNLSVSVQTDVIGSKGWIKVGFNIPQELLLTPSEIKKKPVIITILAVEDKNLYKTYEGDISLKVESEVVLKEGNYTDKKMEEIYLWLRPGTSKWIHREGM